ncbi:MAG: carboxypeptidase-like regulatory domain-containing protein [Hyphomonadaceae bacterium]
MLAPNALAQSQTGALSVTVRGDTGAPVSGATVKVSSPDSLVSRTGVTGTDGSARIAGPDPATNYTIQIAASGFNTFNASSVEKRTAGDGAYAFKEPNAWVGPRLAYLGARFSF